MFLYLKFVDSWASFKVLLSTYHQSICLILYKTMNKILCFEKLVHFWIKLICYVLIKMVYLFWHLIVLNLAFNEPVEFVAVPVPLDGVEFVALHVVVAVQFGVLTANCVRRYRHLQKFDWMTLIDWKIRNVKTY